MDKSDVFLRVRSLTSILARYSWAIFQLQWGEYRDRRKRWQYAEQRSKLTWVERQKAQQLQKEFRTRCCPICLENFDYGEDVVKSSESPNSSFPQDNDKDQENLVSRMGHFESSANSLVSILGDSRKGSVDEFGIPRRGADNKRIKLLRCGHIFCETCWKSWVHSSACGSPCNCPVCRQDVGKSVCRSRRQQETERASIPPSSPRDVSMDIESEVETTSPTTNSTSIGQTYNSFSDTSTGADRQLGSINSASSRIIRVNTMLRGAILFRQTSATANRSIDYVEQLHSTQDGETTPLLAT
jgi:Zinc finger, C3HC4 type (RING finger)